MTASQIIKESRDKIAKLYELEDLSDDELSWKLTQDLELAFDDHNANFRGEYTMTLSDVRCHCEDHADPKTGRSMYNVELSATVWYGPSRLDDDSLGDPDEVLPSDDEREKVELEVVVDGGRSARMTVGGHPVKFYKYHEQWTIATPDDVDELLRDFGFYVFGSFVAATETQF